MDGAKTMAKLVVVVGAISVWSGVGLAPWTHSLGNRTEAPAAHVSVVAAPSLPSTTPAADDLRWLDKAKPFCNAVEVGGFLRSSPFPDGFDGAAQGATCLALAGRIEEARAVVQSLPAEDQWRAAGVIFDAGHPSADAGDDIAAGPLMELVVDFWPNHYMALYHAGASRFHRGDHALAREYLERFLETYSQADGWTRNARTMLAEIRPHIAGA